MSGNDAYTKSLLHLNSDFADVAAGGTHIWTGYGNAQIDAAIKKFGAGSLLLDGDGDYIDTPDSADWAMGSGDFTLDLWFKRGRTGMTEMLCGNADSAGNNSSAAFGIWLPSVPLDGLTKSLLHFNGADLSTIFSDAGPQFASRVWTTYGDAKLSTTSPKFGSAAGLFDGAGDYIDTPDSEDFAMGTGDFTIDFWVKRGSINARQAICGQASTGANNYFGWVEFQANNTIRAFCRNSAQTTDYICTSTGTITDTDTWHHIAFLRYGNQLRLYIDGVLDGTADVTGVTLINSAYKFAIGRGGEYAGFYLNGRVDEFRLKKGVAEWTSNFTPPTSDYTFDRVTGWICYGSDAKNTLSTTDISDTTTWHHIALVRNGNNLLLFLDGVLESTVDVTGISVNDSAYKYAFGREGECISITQNFKGNIDEPRISKGIARWTANFTPPTDEYNGWTPPGGESFVSWIN